MNRAARAIALAGALLCLSAVILAAMGSHLFDMNGMQASWQTAANIHLFSAAAVIGIAALVANLESRLLQWSAWLIILGTVVFCGSIYLHVISGRVLPSVTPSGGLLMMAGWLLMVLTFLRKS